MKMKLSTRAFSVLSLVSLAILFSCGGGGGSDADPRKAQHKKISKTWVLGTATLEGNPSGQIEPDFSITFSGTFNSENPEGPYDFNVTGTLDPSPIPPGGEWFFPSVDGNEGQIVLEGLPVSYTLQTNGNLRLVFNCGAGCGFDGARTSSVEGDWVFDLEPEN
jgi:hypothetical protein